MLDEEQIIHTQKYGMPEPEIIGYCECCGEEINPAYSYCKLDDLYFLDELHFARYAKKHWGLEIVG